MVNPINLNYLNHLPPFVNQPQHQGAPPAATPPPAAAAGTAGLPGGPRTGPTTAMLRHRRQTPPPPHNPADPMVLQPSDPQGPYLEVQAAQAFTQGVITAVTQAGDVVNKELDLEAQARASVTKPP